MTNEGWTTVTTAQSWSDLMEVYADHRNEWTRWIFRGHADASWRLSTRLERELRRFREPLKGGPKYEAWLVREFIRHYYRFDSRDPGVHLAEWLAIMQHHGAPTRLMDWTYSFWGAVFFALDEARAGDRATVWILDRDWFRDRSYVFLHEDLRAPARDGLKDPELIRRVFADSDGAFVFFLNPFRLNERLAVQQGVFAVPRDISVPFEDNLSRSAGSESAGEHLLRIDIEVTADVLKEVLTELYRMNINRTTLFPGLDGLTSDLRNRIGMEHFFRGVPDANLWDRDFLVDHIS